MLEGFLARMEDETVEVHGARRTGGGRGVRGGPEKRVSGISPGRPQSFR